MHFIYKAFCDFRETFFKHITFTFFFLNTEHVCVCLKTITFVLAHKKCALNGAFDGSRAARPSYSEVVGTLMAALLP